MRKVRVAIAGVGNCANSLIQWLEYYRRRVEQDYAGLIDPRIGEWRAHEIMS